jgi:hypothetical protein
MVRIEYRRDESDHAVFGDPRARINHQDTFTVAVLAAIF